MSRQRHSTLHVHCRVHFLILLWGSELFACQFCCWDFLSPDDGLMVPHLLVVSKNSLVLFSLPFRHKTLVAETAEHCGQCFTKSECITIRVESQRYEDLPLDANVKRSGSILGIFQKIIPSMFSERIRKALTSFKLSVWIYFWFLSRNISGSRMRKCRKEKEVRFLALLSGDSGNWSFGYGQWSLVAFPLVFELFFLKSQVPRSSWWHSVMVGMNFFRNGRRKFKNGSIEANWQYSRRPAICGWI